MLRLSASNWSRKITCCDMRMRLWDSRRRKLLRTTSPKAEIAHFAQTYLILRNKINQLKQNLISLERICGQPLKYPGRDISCPISQYIPKFAGFKLGNYIRFDTGGLIQIYPVSNEDWWIKTSRKTRDDIIKNYIDPWVKEHLKISWQKFGELLY